MKPLHTIATSLLAVTSAAVLAAAGSVSLLGQAPAQTPVQAQTPANQPAAQPANRNVVVLDPAHGGPDAGAKIGDGLLEKDVTLALAARLRAALTGAGFSVVSTREGESLNPPTTDQRAETANRAHAVACIVIHATGTGSGVHLYASALEPKGPAEVADDAAAENRPAFEPTPWDAAQADSVAQSLRLESDLGAALRTAGLPVATGRAQLRPLDNLMCPAVAVEVAPLAVAGGDATPVSDADYQQRVAQTLGRALQAWRGHGDAPAAHPAGTPAAGTQPVPAAQSQVQAQAAAKATAAADAVGAATARTHAAGGNAGGTQ